MIRMIGTDVMVVRCASSPQLVGLHGTVALESMRMLTIVSDSRKYVLPKIGTALKVKGTDELLIADEMSGRLEERLARGARV